MSVAQGGGGFVQGFACSAIGAAGGLLASASGSPLGSYGDGITELALARAAVSAAAGCAASAVTGGKCAQAAVTAAFASLYNGDGSPGGGLKRYLENSAYSLSRIPGDIKALWNNFFDDPLDAVNKLATSVPPVAAGPATAAQKILFRRGAHDSLELIRKQAAEAEIVLGHHGLSVSASAAAKPGQVVRCATCAEIEAAGFNIVKTGNSPHHYTVVLPKPITPEVARTWNDLFK